MKNANHEFVQVLQVLDVLLVNVCDVSTDCLYSHLNAVHVSFRQTGLTCE